MKNALVRLGGADPEILAKCVNTNTTQRVKFAGFASLLFIPAILGGVGMCYALSTVSTNRWIYIGGGVLWGFVVLLIDRFLIATFFKSHVEEGYYTSLILRFIFSIFVGLAVSHPMVLLWLNDSIVQRINDMRRDAVSARRDQGSESLMGVPEGPFSQQIREKTVIRDCIVGLNTLEKAGSQSQIECGGKVYASSDEDGCGPICQDNKSEVKKLEDEIADLKKLAAVESQASAGTIQSIQNDTNADMEDIQENFSTDYLARVDALAALESEKPHVTAVKWFLLLFFVFVDALVVLLKWATPMGEYEYVRDALLFDAKKIQEAERAASAAHAENTLPGILQAKRSYESKHSELNHLTDVTAHFVNEQERKRIVLNKEFAQMSARIRKVTDQELRTYYSDYLRKAKESFNAAWTKAYDRFLEYINGL